MSERKRVKRRKDEYTGPGGAEPEVVKPTKDEIAVAKWLRSNVPIKKTKFSSHNVECFTASKALDALMSSKFASGEKCLFPTREIAIEFLDTMLIHKFFHRARKIMINECDLKGKSKKTDKEKEKEKDKDGKEIKDKDDKGTDAENSHYEGKLEKTGEKVKKKRKFRLDMHPEQIFVDGAEVYVWIYDPIPMYYWLIGALLVIGAIVICLFPLWPPTLRKGVYYLSMAAAGFLVFILALVIIRFIVFCLIWIVTASKHHFWLLPNLTEDVGFFESFWPLYKHEYKDGSKSSAKKNKKRKKDKDSDAEDENIAMLNKEKIDNIKENDTGTISNSNLEDEDHDPVERITTVKSMEYLKNDDEDAQETKTSTTPSESESESSQKSSTGRDFEMVDPKEVENQ